MPVRYLQPRDQGLKIMEDYWYFCHCKSIVDRDQKCFRLISLTSYWKGTITCNTNKMYLFSYHWTYIQWEYSEKDHLFEKLNKIRLHYGVEYYSSWLILFLLPF